jgi:hypothetical protein
MKTEIITTTHTILLVIGLFVAGIIMLVKWAFDSEAKESVSKQDSLQDPIEDYYNDYKKK